MSIRSIHASYCDLTSMSVECDLWRERCWFEWEKKGWTENDLKLVVDYIRKTFQGAFSVRMLSFRYLIADLHNFEEYLAQAKALVRPVKTERTKLVEKCGKPEPEKPFQTAGLILERSKFAQMLKEYRENKL